MCVCVCVRARVCTYIYIEKGGPEHETHLALKRVPQPSLLRDFVVEEVQVPLVRGHVRQQVEAVADRVCGACLDVENLAVSISQLGVHARTLGVEEHALEAC